MATHRNRRKPATQPLQAARGQGLATIQSRKVNGFNAQKIAYEPPAEAIDPYLTADVTLTKRIADCLNHHYPAHPWLVQVTHAQGVAMIKLPLIMPKNDHWVIKISTINVDPSLKCVMRAAGEILERYNMPRHGFSLDKFLVAREAGPYGRKPRPRLIMPEFASSVRRPGDSPALITA